MPSSLRSWSPRDSSVKNTPPRTSATMATRPGWPEVEASSAIFRMSAGGRLSTTKYPRSSNDFAASDRPAPDWPVMMVKSTVRSASGAGRFSLCARAVATSAHRSSLDRMEPMEVLVDRPGSRRPDPGRPRDLLRRGGPEASHRSEPLQEGLLPGRTHPRDVVQHRPDGPLGPLCPMVGDGEPVGFVPDVLQEEQGLRSPGDGQGLGLAWDVDLLQPFGQADRRDG